jgi:hypothetical protein
MDAGGEQSLDSLFGQRSELDGGDAAFRPHADQPFGFATHPAMDAIVPDAGAFELHQSLIPPNEHRVI